MKKSLQEHKQFEKRSFKEEDAGEYIGVSRLGLSSPHHGVAANWTVIRNHATFVTLNASKHSIDVTLS